MVDKVNISLTRLQVCPFMRGPCDAVTGKIPSLSSVAMRLNFNVSFGRMYSEPSNQVATLDFKIT